MLTNASVRVSCLPINLMTGGSSLSSARPKGSVRGVLFGRSQKTSLVPDHHFRIHSFLHALSGVPPGGHERAVGRPVSSTTNRTGNHMDRGNLSHTSPSSRALLTCSPFHFGTCQEPPFWRGSQDEDTLRTSDTWFRNSSSPESPTSNLIALLTSLT